MIKNSAVIQELLNDINGVPEDGKETQFQKLKRLKAFESNKNNIQDSKNKLQDIIETCNNGIKKLNNNEIDKPKDFVNNLIKNLNRKN